MNRDGGGIATRFSGGLLIWRFCHGCSEADQAWPCRDSDCGLDDGARCWCWAFSNNNMSSSSINKSSSSSNKSPVPDLSGSKDVAGVDGSALMKGLFDTPLDFQSLGTSPNRFESRSSLESSRLASSGATRRGGSTGVVRIGSGAGAGIVSAADAGTRSGLGAGSVST